MLKWYRKYWHPWGRTIGFHEVAYVEVNGIRYQLNRYFAKQRVKFYVPHGLTDGKGGVLRFRSLKQTLEFLNQLC
jgi:hypothetical protein